MTSSEAPPKSGELFRHRRKGSAVVDGGPEPRQRREMLRHAVAHVALEAVAGVREAEPRHQPVARHLGDDGGGGNRGDQAHRRTPPSGIRSGSRFCWLPSTNTSLRPARQRLHRAGKRPERGAQDIVAVDALDRAEGHRHLRASRRFSRRASRALRRRASWSRSSRAECARDRAPPRRRPPGRRAVPCPPRRSRRPARCFCCARSPRAGNSGLSAGSLSGRCLRGLVL